MSPPTVDCILEGNWDTGCEPFIQAIRTRPYHDERFDVPAVLPRIPHQQIRADVTDLWDGPYSRCPLVLYPNGPMAQWMEVFVTCLNKERVADRTIATFRIEGD